MAINPVRTGNAISAPPDSIALSSLKAIDKATPNGQAGKLGKTNNRMASFGTGVRNSAGTAANSAANPAPNPPLLAGRPTRTREQFETWFDKDQSVERVAAALNAGKYNDPTGVDTKMIAGLTYIGTSGNYPKSIASVALSLRSEVFVASAKVDKAKAAGNVTKINDAIYDLNAARSDAYKYFNKFVVVDPNPGVILPGNPPLTDI
jgi:hypothetical protein